MSANLSGRDPSIRYSEAFKMQVVRELEESGAPFAQLRRKYGIRGRRHGGELGAPIRQRNPRQEDSSAKA